MKRVIQKLRHYHSALGIRGVLLFVFSKLFHFHPLMGTRLAGIAHPVYVRIGTTDASVLKQVLIEKHYDYDLSVPPKVIIDAGANIGLAAVYFANQYPDALIVAIEPESSNLKVLRKNVAPYPQIKVMAAALWRENRQISLFDSGQGNDGFQTSEANGTANECKGSVKGMTVEAVMRETGVNFVDVLKIDIEGAEKEVFENSGPWIDDVGVVMAELHDHLKTGCREAFSEATKSFAAGQSRGETIIRLKQSNVLLPGKNR